MTNPAKGLARLNMRDDDIPAMHPTPPLPTDSFRDITAEFFEASESTLHCLRYIRLSTDAVILELNVGQLVKDPYFTLLQAVGALEACIQSLLFLLLRLQDEVWLIGCDVDYGPKDGQWDAGSRI